MICSYEYTNRSKKSSSGSGSVKKPPATSGTKKPITPPSMKSTASTTPDDEDVENYTGSIKGNKSNKNQFKDNDNNVGSSSTSNKREVYEDVLSELDDSLKNRLPNSLRQKLLTYLRSRIESLQDPTKRETTVSKIAERLGDTNYWIDYAARL